MTYHLTYEDFGKLVAKLNRTDSRIAGTTVFGRQDAATEWWMRYERCFGRPVPRPVLLPRSDSCDPMVFETEKKAENVFLKRAKQRNDRVPGYELGRCNVGRRSDRGLGRAELLTDSTPVPPLEDDLDGTVDVRSALERLRELIRTSTVVRRRQYAAEIVATLLAAVDLVEQGDSHIERGADRDLISITDELLRTRFPNLLGTDPRGRQRRRRALEDIAEFLNSLHHEIRRLVGVHEPGDEPEATRSEP